MVLEATMICVDNSEYQRNGDYDPCRMQAQTDAAALVFSCKLRANPESAVGLLTMAEKVEVLSTLTQDNSKLYMQLNKTQPGGLANYMAGIRVAALALKHRQNRNQRQRIVVFVGSPFVDVQSADLVRLGKKLKKDKVCVDVVVFGTEANLPATTELVNAFVDALNGQSETPDSHVVCVPTGVVFPEALLSSSVCRSGDTGPPAGAMAHAQAGVAAAAGGGAPNEFGFDPTEDPELAMALRVSLEEQRQREDATAEPMETAATVEADVDIPYEAMTEEQQLNWALQMSMQAEQDEAAAAAGAAADPPSEEVNDDDALMAEITDPTTLAAMVSDLTAQTNAEDKEQEEKASTTPKKKDGEEKK